MIFEILTIFPDLLSSPLNEGILRKARQEGKIDIRITDIRNFTTDRHNTTDDRPFGGGEGMVMKPEPLARAIEQSRSSGQTARVILLTPQGRRYDQSVARELAQEERLILVCGRYEGVDERFRSAYCDDELSIGDFILTGGELAAMVVIDSVARLLPGVLGCPDSADKDTFSRNLLKHPQYTRPRDFQGMEVPEVLLEGNHGEISSYRFIEAVRRTLQRRPELLRQERFSLKEVQLLKKHDLYKAVQQIQDGLVS
jgi:tRNA (guanine37-N1)-methyltransferase